MTTNKELRDAVDAARKYIHWFKKDAPNKPYPPFMTAKNGITQMEVILEAAERALDGWKSIDTAPFETDILVRYGNNYQASDGPFVGAISKIDSAGGAYARPSNLQSECGCSIQKEYVTQWQPLPSAPEQGDGG